MVAEELINHMIPPLKVTDTARKAKMWMEELRCNQLPVSDGGKFLGLITEEIILEENDIDKLIREFDLIGRGCVVRKNSHFYEVIKLATDNDLERVCRTPLHCLHNPQQYRFREGLLCCPWIKEIIPWLRSAD